MRPAVLIPVIVFVMLCIVAAWAEYSQHSGLMLQSASADLAQLCTDLEPTRACPNTQRLGTRVAKDPWAQPYRCRTIASQLLVYTLGADDKIDGTGRDADIVCSTAFARAQGEQAAPCSCLVGADASALLR
jgi:hypothetical protein